MSYLIELLNPTHKRDEFDCEQESLNLYLHKHASQDVERHLAVCYVIVTDKNEVKGYYTLSNSSIDKDLIPNHIRKKLSYKDIPVTLSGRLARDKRYYTERLGETLLLDALHRCYDSSFKIGSLAVVVDPIDEKARAFYLKYGFINLPDCKKMFISMKTISQIFKS